MKKLLIILAMLLYVFDLSAQEVDFSTMSEKDVYKVINKAIEEKDESIISTLGSLGSDFPGYSKFVKYILEKAEILIKSSDLAFPQLLIETILYIDFENEKAQELYAVIIDKKIDNQERLEAEILKEEAKREEIAEFIEEIDEEIVHEEFMREIVGISSELISTIDLNMNTFNSINYISSIYFYPLITKFYSSEVYDGFHSRDATTNSYNGQGLDVGIGVMFKYLAFRTDAYVNMTYENLFGESMRQVTGGANLSLGISAIKIPIFLRAGFIYDLYLYENGVSSDVAITNLSSPSVGLGLVGFNLFKVLKVDLTFDTILASIDTVNLEYAFLGKAYLTVNVFRLGEHNIEFKGGVDTIYLNEGDLSEVSITPRFGLGVSSYE